jgi:CRISPR/Cas system CSM-associated protein Csm5 (group 7 of RAMP superfamily)
MKIELETITPVHIGSGNILSNGLEYIYKDRKIIKFNLDSIAYTLKGKLESIHRLSEVRKLIRPSQCSKIL